MEKWLTSIYFKSQNIIWYLHKSWQMLFVKSYHRFSQYKNNHFSQRVVAPWVFLYYSFLWMSIVWYTCVRCLATTHHPAFSFTSQEYHGSLSHHWKLRWLELVELMVVNTVVMLRCIGIPKTMWREGSWSERNHSWSSRTTQFTAVVSQVWNEFA